MKKPKNQLQELREKGSFHLNRSGFFVMGVGLVVVSLIVSHLLTWATGLLLGA